MSNELVLYDDGFEDLFDGTFNWAEESDIAAVLLTDSYTPDAGHSTYNDLTNECDDSDYEPKAVSNRSVTRNGDDCEFDSDKVDFGSDVSITARYLALVVGDPTSLASDDKLIGYVDFGESKSSSNSEFSFDPASTGWFKVSRPS